MLRLLFILLCLFAVVSAVVVRLSAAAPSALPRATVDRPDEVAGAQVHFLYVVATDASDEQLDVNGVLSASIARMQAWLAQQTGGPKFRIDTFQGEPDITFLRASLDFGSIGDLSIRGAFSRLGFASANKTYVAYHATRDFDVCGEADAGGRAALVSLACTRASPSEADVLDFVTMHETLHALGAVPKCAPHHSGAGHVSDRRDLMYPQLQFDDNARFIRPVLDVGRDDYYGHGRRDCLDIARSLYLDSNSRPKSNTPPKSNPLRLGAISRVKATRGRLTIRATLTGVATSPVSVRCSARVAKRPLRVLSTGYADRVARCTFAVGARPGIATGKLTVRSGQTVARTFRLRV